MINFFLLFAQTTQTETWTETWTAPSNLKTPNNLSCKYFFLKKKTKIRKMKDNNQNY